MPQLDIYIIWDIIFYVLIVWLYIYKLNISTIIIILNIILRVRKIKMQGDKKYSYFLLKEILINMKLKIYEYSFSNKYNILKKKNNIFILKDILDIWILKKKLKKWKWD